LNRSEAAEVDKDRLRGEGGKSVFAVGDAAGLVPALRVVEEPTPPEFLTRLAAQRSRLEALQLDAARKPMQPRSFEAEQRGHLGPGARRNDQPRAAPRPAAQPSLPSARVLPGRWRPRL